MALLFFEGWDTYSHSNGNEVLWLAKGWAATGNWGSFNITTGRFSGSAWYSNNQSNDVSCRYDFGGNKTVVITGCAVHQVFAGTLTKAIRVLELTDGTSVQIGLGINTSRQLFVYRGTTSTVIATSTTTVAAGQWAYLELQATLDNSAGTISVRKDSAAVADLTLTGQDTTSTANNYATGVQVVGHQAQATNNYSTQIDDFYVCDTSGSAPYNDFLGEIRVQTLAPSAAGSSTQWTPSTGANHAAVDELNTLPADTDYVSSSTAGQVDLYTIPDLTGSPAVYSVAVSIAARKDDVGTRSIRAKLKSGSTTADGTTTSIGSAYAVVRQQWDLDPNGNVSWTPAAVNAAEIGVELVA